MEISAMKLLGQRSLPMPHSVMCRLARAGLALLLIPVCTGAVEPATEIVKAQAFDEAFTDYYDALSDHDPEDLRLELSETIEDVLSSGSHLTRASLDYKTRQIETGLFAHLRGPLCGASSRAPEDMYTVKLSTVRSVARAGAEAGVTLSQEELGMVSGVVVRLVQRTPRPQLCSGS